MADDVLLSATGIRKHFGGLAALSDVSITVRRGEIFGLIGPNGAGKTTLFNVLTGLTRPDSGTLSFDGTRIDGLKPYAVARHGIARTFQNIRLFGSMTALENVMVGRHLRSTTGVLGAAFRTRHAVAEEQAITKRAAELLEYCGLSARSGNLARDLPYGDQRRLEIARALATEPKLLALDEPAAGMNATETAALTALLERIRASAADGRPHLWRIDAPMGLAMPTLEEVGVTGWKGCAEWMAGCAGARDWRGSVHAHQAALGGARHQRHGRRSPIRPESAGCACHRSSCLARPRPSLG